MGVDRLARGSRMGGGSARAGRGRRHDQRELHPTRAARPADLRRHECDARHPAGRAGRSPSGSPARHDPPTLERDLEHARGVCRRRGPRHPRPPCCRDAAGRLAGEGAGRRPGGDGAAGRRRHVSAELRRAYRIGHRTDVGGRSPALLRRRRGHAGDSGRVPATGADLAHDLRPRGRRCERPGRCREPDRCRGRALPAGAGARSGCDLSPAVRPTRSPPASSPGRS